MEILGPTSNVQGNEASGPKITLQGIEAASSGGVPKVWRGSFQGLLVVLAALGVQALGCLGLVVAGAMAHGLLGTYASWLVGAAQGLFVVGVLLALSVPARDVRVVALIAAVLWAGAAAVAVLFAPTGSGWYVLAVLLVVAAYGVWALFLRGVGSRFDASTLNRDTMILWGVIIAAGVYFLLMASPESRASHVENGFFGLVVTLWHGMIILQARKAIREGD